MKHVISRAKEREHESEWVGEKEQAVVNSYLSGNRYVTFFELAHANEISSCYRKPFVRETLKRLLQRINFIKNDFMESIRILIL